MLTRFLITLQALLSPASAQEPDMAELNPGVPSGIAESSGEWQATIPMPCSSGCYIPASAYYYCFLKTTLEDGRQANQTECNAYLCKQETYNQILACLNCIVADGDERPYGYHTNPSLTAPQTDDPLSPTPIPVGGYIDEKQANGWLANITNRCESVGSAISGSGGGATTITASPTTTGQTLRFTTWTGLTEYAEQFFPSMTPVFGPLDTGSSESTTVSSSGMFTSSTPSSTGSASAQATSVPNSGKVQATSEGVLWIVPMLGLFGLL